ncbi:hypothetical protein A9Q83_16030 [Alphaproteobacteria bacterium 46_93_T64]|mgnify:CR=1 FL=1|nr:hypothetical protein A9Q83_16030 [Alphaproteobacteria bacterium 46_93_T64]
MIMSSRLQKKSLKTVVILAATLALAACVSKPIYNVESRSFTSEAKLPIATIQQKIKLIGADRGWTFQDVTPGHMIGSVGTAKHNAKVDLNYTETTFSIKYLSSYQLKANGATIHHRYNRWVENLERDLVIKLGLASNS